MRYITLVPSACLFYFTRILRGFHCKRILVRTFTKRLRLGVHRRLDWSEAGCYCGAVGDGDVLLGVRAVNHVCVGHYMEVRVVTFVGTSILLRTTTFCCSNMYLRVLVLVEFWDRC